MTAEVFNDHWRLRRFVSGHQCIVAFNRKGENVETFVARPSAAILIRSLRGFPYTLETALADIIDNSITAGAGDVRIFAEANSGFPRLAVVDNGAGMTAEELHQAMRLGSKDPAAVRSESDLGRFGLGLKTASFSQCRRLTVATRREGEWHAARWDLGYVYDTDEWNVQVLETPEALPWADQVGDQGTLVLWEELDRVIDSESLDEIAREFNRRVSSSATHLELVFHRFLEGERGLPKVSISLNGGPLKPHNPFNPRNPATISDPEEIIGVSGAKVVAKAYTLPHFSKVTPDEWDKYAGERGYLRNQGFYLYRAGRLIVHGTWFGLIRQNDLTKLARVRVDIPNGMDELWKIDVLKASAHPPHVVRQRLRRIVERLSSTSRRVHTNRGAKLADTQSFPLWERRSVHEGVRYGVNLQHPAIQELLASVGDEQQAPLTRMMQLLGASLPIDSLIVDLGDRPHAVRGADASDEAVELLIRSVCAQLRPAGMEWDDLQRVLKSNEVAASNWELAQNVLRALEESENP